MFINNHFTDEYLALIRGARLRLPIKTSRYIAKKTLGYVERHHIIPTSLDGDNSHENAVWLTAHEHLRAHLLLTEMCENEGHRHKMLLAAVRMMNRQDSKREREQLLPLQITEEEIAWLARIREASAIAHGSHLKEKYKGIGNPFFGKKHTPESNAKRGLWTSENNPMYNEKIVASLSGDNHYSKKPEHKGKQAGMKNGRYNPTQYRWQNIITGETKTATRLQMITQDPTLKGNISQVITGHKEHVKGWRIVQD